MAGYIEVNEDGVKNLYKTVLGKLVGTEKIDIDIRPAYKDEDRTDEKVLSGYWVDVKF